MELAKSPPHGWPGRLSGRRPTRTALVAIAVAALTLSACGSGSDSGSGSGSSGGGSVDKDGLTAAQQTIDKVTARPTEIPVSKPIGADIPPGGSIVFISCGSAACNLEGDIIRAATDVLKWTTSVVNTNGSPESVKAAWQQAVAAKPTGILYTATLRSGFEQELQQAKDAGITVAACCTTDPPENGLDYVIAGPEEARPLGDAMAAWATTESKGDGDAVYFDLPAFPILTSLKEGFVDGMKKYCPDACSAETQDVPLTAIGKDVPQRIVSYLRSHPDTKYVALAVDDLAIGLPAALSAAGLNDVKIIGEGANTTTLQYIGSGQQSASLAFPYYEEMWSMVDAVAREAAGVPIEKAGSPPVWMVTKDNVPSTSELFPLVKDYKEQFLSFWGKGS
jgi:ABC-type sugar transport system substrate-binding protein